MLLRLATAIALTIGLAAFIGRAEAQFAMPAPPPGYTPPAAVPADDDDDDVVTDPQIQSQPLPPPSGRSAAPLTQPPFAQPPMASADPRAPAAPVELTAPGRPSPEGGLAATARQDVGPGSVDQGLRPPADIEATGSVPAPVPGSAPANSVASLPADYQPEQGEPKELPPHLRRQIVEYWTKEPAGTIIIDTPNTYLYLVLSEGKALRYGIGVGREGFTWSGREKITRMAEWPDWYPPAEMIERQPYLPRFMAGGETNPLGARALYLGKTVYRIHGTNQPSTIGTFVSSGCIRLINEDVEDLYQRVKVGTKVVVLPANPPVPVANHGPAPPTPASASAAPATASNAAPQAH